MVAKKIGISDDWIIHPGETIADVLENRGITQAELAVRTGVTPAYISLVVAGKKSISAKFAAALEYGLAVRKSFWLNLQANYEAEKLDLDAKKTITPTERAAKDQLAAVTKYLRNQEWIPPHRGTEDTILSLRHFFQMSNLADLEKLISTGSFRLSTYTHEKTYVLGAWLRLCQMAGEKSRVETSFNPAKAEDLITNLKKVMRKQEHEIPNDLPVLFAKYGIGFSVFMGFPGAPAQGYLAQKQDQSYQMVLTPRDAYADRFWVSLFDELGHIIRGEVPQTRRVIDVMDKPDRAHKWGVDCFACDALLNRQDYQKFINDGAFSLPDIRRFADEQQVVPSIVIGRLQQEGAIFHNEYAEYKTKYQWNHTINDSHFAPKIDMPIAQGGCHVPDTPGLPAPQTGERSTTTSRT